MKTQILSNKPHPSTPTYPEPSHFSDEETEAQREIAMGAGSHSMSGQNEAHNPGSQGQGLGSPHDAHGHLLPIAGVSGAKIPALPKRGDGQTGPSVGPPRNSGSCVVILKTSCSRLSTTKALSKGFILAPPQLSSFCSSRWEAYLIGSYVLTGLGGERPWG